MPGETRDAFHWPLADVYTKHSFTLFGARPPHEHSDSVAVASSNITITFPASAFSIGSNSQR
jgi:hypothetical protein